MFTISWEFSLYLKNVLPFEIRFASIYLYLCKEDIFDTWIIDDNSSPPVDNGFLCDPFLFFPSLWQYSQQMLITWHIPPVKFVSHHMSTLCVLCILFNS